MGSTSHNDPLADLQRKLEAGIQLQEHVIQQQRTIEHELRTTKQELESKDIEMANLRKDAEKLENISKAELLLQLAEKDETIAQQQLIIVDLKNKVVGLERENEDKSTIVKLLRNEIDRLNLQIMEHTEQIKRTQDDQQESDRRFKKIYNAQVLNALKGKARPSCIENLRLIVSDPETKNDDPQIAKDFKALIESGGDAKDAATAFLNKHTRLREFNSTQRQILIEIEKRVSHSSFESILCILNKVGEESQLQDKFFDASSGVMNLPEKVAENFTEEFPSYYTPLTFRAKSILQVVRDKVTKSDYDNLYRDVTSNETGSRNNKNRALFHRLALLKESDRSTAKRFIRESKTQCDGFWAKYW